MTSARRRRARSRSAASWPRSTARSSSMRCSRTSSTPRRSCSAPTPPGCGSSSRAASRSSWSRSRDLGQELIDVVASVYEDEDVMGLRAIARAPADRDRRSRRRRRDFGPIYERLGFRTVNFVPLLFRDEHVGLLVLYHRTPYDWSPDELELCTSFANQMATAFANARLFATVREGAARLRAIQELSSRLNRIQDVEKIGDAIVAEADRLIRHDTIRVYSVDPVTGMCEPIAFHGEFSGIGTLNRDVLRLPDRRGADGLGRRAQRDHPPRRRGRRSPGPPAGHRRTCAESMLLVPMSYESRVLGVIVVSKVRLRPVRRGRPADARDLRRLRGPGGGQRRGVRAGRAASRTSSTTASRASAACSRSTSACSRPSTRAACSR